MKKINKILGVGLIVVLLVSLLSFAAPVSAETPLTWQTETIPTESDQILVTGNVTDIAVGGDGNFIMAGSGSTLFYKSTDRGATWTTVTTSNNTHLVAVAPDDNDIIVWATASSENQTVWVSDSGGTFKDDLGLPTDATSISDLAISANRFGSHRIAITGTSNSANGSGVWEYELGAAAPTWTALSGERGFGQGHLAGGDSNNSTAVAVAFSPNFASDEVMVVLTVGWDTTDTTTDNVSIEMYSFDSGEWNEDGAGFQNYPVNVVTSEDITGAISGSLSLSPDYLGSDDAFRLAFIGLDLEGDLTINGIYRADDDTAKAIKDGTGVRIKSVAYDGTYLVAGRNNDTTT